MPCTLTKEVVADKDYLYEVKRDTSTAHLQGYGHGIK